MTPFSMLRNRLRFFLTALIDLVLDHRIMVFTILLEPMLVKIPYFNENCYLYHVFIKLQNSIAFTKLNTFPVYKNCLRGC